MEIVKYWQQFLIPWNKPQTLVSTKLRLWEFFLKQYSNSLYKIMYSKSYLVSKWQGQFLPLSERGKKILPIFIIFKYFQETTSLKKRDWLISRRDFEQAKNGFQLLQFDF